MGSKQYVGLWLPQSYNHVGSWNTFSIYHCSFCSLLCLYKLVCLTSSEKGKLLLYWLFVKLLTLKHFFGCFILFLFLVCLQK